MKYIALKGEVKKSGPTKGTMNPRSERIEGRRRYKGLIDDLKILKVRKIRNG